MPLGSALPRGRFFSALVLVLILDFSVLVLALVLRLSALVLVSVLRVGVLALVSRQSKAVSRQHSANVKLRTNNW